MHTYIVHTQNENKETDQHCRKNLVQNLPESQRDAAAPLVLWRDCRTPEWMCR